MTEFNQKQLFGRVRDNCKSIDPVTGTTTNSFIEVIDLDTRQFRDTEFIIANTSSSNSLYYTIKVRSEYDDGTDFAVFSNEVKPDSVDEAILVRHARIFIFIKSNTTDLHTDYSISCIGGT